MKLSDIKPNPDNPRSIEDDRDAALDESLEKYGDLSGVVYNSNPECPALVSAHQRLRKFKKDKWKLIVTERFKEPQSKGTVAWGYVESPDGERYVYREVHWPKRKADEATIVANGQFGKWDADVLSSWEFEMDELRDMGVPEWVFGGDGEGEGGVPSNALNSEKKDPFEDEGISGKNAYGVIIMCESEEAQETVFNKMQSDGYVCKIVVV